LIDLQKKRRESAKGGAYHHMNNSHMGI